MTEPSRVDVEQSVVYSAVVARLRTALGLTDRQCYEVTDPNAAPILPTGGDCILTVSPGSGGFVDEEQVIGNTTEFTEVIVSGYTRIRTDSTNSDKFLLLDEQRGLFAIKKKILKALVGQDLEDTEGNKFLRQVCFATRADVPQMVERNDTGNIYGCIRVTFGVMFDWDLT